MSRLEKFAPLSGFVTIALLLSAILLTGTFDYFPKPDRAVEIFSQHSTRVAWGGIFGIYSAVFLVWFAGSVFKALQEGKGTNNRLSTISFGGGIISGISAAAGYGVIYAAGARAGRPGGISAEQAVMMYDLYTAFAAGLLTTGLAVFIGAAGISCLRIQSLPTWLGWASLVITIGLLTPFHYIFEGLSMLWIVVVSIVLYRKENLPTVSNDIQLTKMEVRYDKSS